MSRWNWAVIRPNTPKRWPMAAVVCAKLTRCPRPGQQVKDWLERFAKMFNQVAQGAQDVVLLTPAFPSNTFDVIDKVIYQIDLSQPSKYDPDGKLLNANANRIVNLSYNGGP